MEEETGMKSVYALMIAAACLGACKKRDASGASGDATGAKEVMSALAKPGADTTALTNALRPKPEDYAAVFVGDAAEKVKAGIEPLWDGGKLTLKPSADQTEVTVVGAPQPELAKGDGNAVHCPGGYKDIAAKIQPGVVVHCVRFTKPGEKGGLHVDGLVNVNGHWALFPKPWRFLK
jgi:hypothetical protein